MLSPEGVGHDRCGTVWRTSPGLPRQPGRGEAGRKRKPPPNGPEASSSRTALGRAGGGEAEQWKRPRRGSIKEKVARVPRSETDDVADDGLSDEDGDSEEQALPWNRLCYEAPLEFLNALVRPRDALSPLRKGGPAAAEENKGTVGQSPMVRRRGRLQFVG